MTFPRVYSGKGEKLVASYSYADIAEGTGITIYYGATTTDSTGSSQYLSGSTNRTSDIELGGTGVSNVTLIEEFDFDLGAFNTPRILRGTAIVSLGLHHVRGDGGAHGELQAIIKKWDGTSETILVTIESESYTATADYNIVLLPVIPKTYFKKGEILRLTIKTTHGNGAVGGSKMIIGNSPLNRDGALLIPSTNDITTQLIFKVPSDIDL